jgi:hypothetical protein
MVGDTSDPGSTTGDANCRPSKAVRARALLLPAAGDHQRHRRADDYGDRVHPPVPAVPEDNRGNRAVEAHGGSGMARGE